MFITNIRSSGFNCHSLCPHKFYIEFVLGMKFKPGKNADLGNATHKALELLALQRLAVLKNELCFTDNEVGTFNVQDFTVEHAVRIGYEHYKKLTPHHEWTDRDHVTVMKYVMNTLEFNGGIYDPRRRHIIAAEQFFELEIDRNWAAYQYQIGDEQIDGHLKLFGTIDLVTELDKETAEILDWKSGKCTTYPEGKDKDSLYVNSEPQFLIYFWAAKRLYPQYKQWLMTVWYAQFNKPYTIYFDADYEREAEQKLERKFKCIQEMQRTTLNRGWWCGYPQTCGPGTHKYKNSGKTYCQYFEQLNKTKSCDEIFIDYGDVGVLKRYGDGGGKRAA